MPVREQVDVEPLRVVGGERARLRILHVHRMRYRKDPRDHSDGALRCSDIGGQSGISRF